MSRSNVSKPHPLTRKNLKSHSHGVRCSGPATRRATRWESSWGPACLALLVVLLAACAPATSGASIRDAMPVASGQQLEVERGEELFVRLDLTLAEFGLKPADLSGAFWIPAGVHGESANLSTRFTLQKVRVPLRWSLELAEIRAERRRQTQYGKETGEIDYSILPVLWLQVPDSAELGVSTVRAELVSKRGGKVDITFPIRVRAPAAP